MPAMTAVPIIGAGTMGEGIASPRILNAAVKASFGFRLAWAGPTEAEDFIGLDTCGRCPGTSASRSATGPAPPE